MTCNLLVLLGLNPKVLTETLYVLCVKRKVRLKQVIGIATASAREVTIRDLLHPAKGRFYDLCREYPSCFDSVRFSEECIRVAQVRDRDINDIASSRQSQAYLDLLMATIVELTAAQAPALYGVVAGGRRTLSVYLAMVMQLLARPQDKLFHLVVDPWDAELKTDFYFPTRKSLVLETPDGRSFDAHKVAVDLVEIPFLRLRPRVPRELLDSRDYEDILRWVQRDVDFTMPVLPLRLDASKRQIRIGALSVDFEPAELAIYWYFAERSSKRPREVAHAEYTRYFARPEADGYFTANTSARIRYYYRKIVPKKDMRDRFEGAMSADQRLSLYHLRPHFSNIKRKICAKVPNEDLHRWYLISTVGPRGNTSYGIKLDREFIRLPEPKL